MMDLPDLIRCKMFPTSIKFQLLDIARQDNIVENLLDYINENILSREDKEALEKRIDKLEEELNTKRENVFTLGRTLDKLRENNNVRITTFNEFVKSTQQKEDRYPSIDEVWKNAWESCLKAVKNGDIKV